jgi:hypothetical protein
MPDSRMRSAAQLAGAVALFAMAVIAAPSVSIAQDDFSGIMGAGTGMSSLDFDAARMSFFNKADVNGDFALSSDEMAQAMAHGGSRLFEGYDQDGDGLISFDEYIQSGNELFSSLDADGDGVLSSMEM